MKSIKKIIFIIIKSILNMISLILFITGFIAFSMPIHALILILIAVLISPTVHKEITIGYDFNIIVQVKIMILKIILIIFWQHYFL